MADILPFSKPMSRSKPKTTNKQSSNKQGGNTLCKSGFHKWKADKNTDFAVKQGKLLTRYICERCGKTKTEAS